MQESVDSSVKPSGFSPSTRRRWLAHNRSRRCGFGGAEDRCGGSGQNGDDGAQGRAVLGGQEFSAPGKDGGLQRGPDRGGGSYVMKSAGQAGLRTQGVELGVYERGGQGRRYGVDARRSRDLHGLDIRRPARIKEGEEQDHQACRHAHSILRPLRDVQRQRA